MKKLLMVLVMVLTFTVLQADVIFVTDVRAEADLIVYVTDSKAVADIEITISSKVAAEMYSNSWYFTEYRGEADKIVYYSDNKLDATVIYYTEYNMNKEEKPENNTENIYRHNVPINFRI
jgi:hypothetical protein